MKQLLFLVGLSLLTSVCMAQRLPQIAVPDSYRLSLDPDLTNNTFAGTETIQVRLLKLTSEIVLNAKEIDFKNVSITSASGAQKASVTLDKENQMATLAVDKPLQPGPATIQISYTGILNDELRGFYIGKDDQGRKYAATQLEDTDARRAFPSFDEPAYKATFDLTVIADKEMTEK
jgi:aminopeptidase N